MDLVAAIVELIEGVCGAVELTARGVHWIVHFVRDDPPRATADDLFDR